jgi:hypothetical protein
MNIHPLFVHFPIGLLVTYSVLEIGAYLFPSLRRHTWIFPVKTFLLFVGVLAALATLVTGSMAKGSFDATDPQYPIIGVHAPFATATTILYLVLAAAYLIRVFDREGWGNRIVGTNGFFVRLWSFKRYVAHLVLDTWLLPILALLALIGITVTGALGAAIVYGPTTDPFVSFIYHLFWAQ